MRMTKTLAVVAALMFAAVPGCGSHDQRCDTNASLLCGSTLIVGVVDDRPGFAVGDVNPSGFDIDVMHALGTGLHLQTTTHVLTSADRVSELQNRQVTLVIAIFSITPQRNDSGIDFAGPYMVSPQALLVRANDKRIKNGSSGADSVKGKSVCTVGTTTGASVKIPGAIMSTQASTTKECVGLLDQRKVDAVFTDTLVLEGYLQAGGKKYRVVQSGTWGETQYYGVGLLRGHRADCERINAVLTDYLAKQWRTDFQATLPKAASTASGGDTHIGDFESVFKPKESDMTRLTCIG